MTIIILSILLVLLRGYHLLSKDVNSWEPFLPPFVHSDLEKHQPLSIESLLLSPRQIHKSILNLGRLNTAALEKIRARTSGIECLSFVVIGGSVSTGHAHIKPMLTMNNMMRKKVSDDIPNGYNNSFSFFLETILNDYIVTKARNCRHVVYNHAVRGVGTSFWIDRIIASKVDKSDNFISHIENAVAIFIDTSLNGWKSNNETELLLQLIYSVNPHILIVYVGVSGTPPLHWNEEPTNNLAKQMDILLHYNISVLSIIDGLGPFHNDNVQYWFRNKYLVDDDVHPGIMGHKIIALFIFNFLMTYNQTYFNAPYESRKVSNSLKYWTKSDIDAYTQCVPIVFDFEKWNKSTTSHQYASISSGWKVFEDMPGKPGLIAYDIGENVTIRLPESSSSMKWGFIHVLLLQSYAHMGSIEVSLSRGNYHTNAIFNCLWNSKTSQSISQHLSYNVKKFKAAVGETILLLQIIPSVKTKDENKVKLNSLIVC